MITWNRVMCVWRLCCGDLCIYSDVKICGIDLICFINSFESWRCCASWMSAKIGIWLVCEASMSKPLIKFNCSITHSLIMNLHLANPPLRGKWCTYRILQWPLFSWNTISLCLIRLECVKLILRHLSHHIVELFPFVESPDGQINGPKELIKIQRA